MKKIIFYLSDHGFGHIARTISIIAAAVRSRETHAYVVCGPRQNEFARQNLRLMLTAEEYGSITFRAEHTDIGLIVREGTLDVDTDALTKATSAYLAELPERAKRESEWLKENRIDAALCDMPVWSIEACELAGVPLLYIGNFTWTELYREFLPERIWKAYAVYYGKIRHAMLYALHNQEMLAYLKNAERQETSVTARPFDKEAVAAIKSRHDRKLVFVALGMSAQFRKAADVSGTPYDFYTTQGVPLAGDNVEVIPYTTVNTQDYIAAADYVITKAGWGTVSECLLAGKRMALFRRDGVLEDRTTIRLLEEKHLAAPVTAEELCDISGIIKKLDRLDGSCGGFDDCAAEVAEKLCSL